MISPPKPTPAITFPFRVYIYIYSANELECTYANQPHSKLKEADQRRDKRERVSERRERDREIKKAHPTTTKRREKAALVAVRSSFPCCFSPKLRYVCALSSA